MSSQKKTTTSIIVAMRGRGEIQKTRQQLEPRFDGISNTITLVQKDNLILEVAGYNEKHG